MADGLNDDSVPPPPSYDDIVRGNPNSETARLMSPTAGQSGTAAVSTSGYMSTISGSPHGSDDEETSLLKAELRRLREENMQQRKKELRRAIDMERSYAAGAGSGQYGSGTNVHTAGSNPAVHQPAFSHPPTQVAQAVSYTPPSGIPQHQQWPQHSTSVPVPVNTRGPQPIVHPMVTYGTPQGARPTTAPMAAVASSSTAADTGHSPEDDDKKNSNGSTAACVITFFVIISVTVVIVAIYGAV